MRLRLPALSLVLAGSAAVLLGATRERAGDRASPRRPASRATDEAAPAPVMSHKDLRPSTPSPLRPDSVPSPAPPGAAEPNLAVDEDGRVYLSWLEPADSGHALRFAVHDGQRWSAPLTIRAGRDFFVNWADFPSLEVLGRDRLAAHWLQKKGAGSYAYGVRVALSTDGGKRWSAPVTPHRDSSESEHGFVSLWPEPGGRLGAAWLDGRKFSKQPHARTNEMMLVSTTVTATGALGAESRLDERTCDCCQSAAAVTSAGPVIAYRDRSPEEIRDIYVARRVRGRWTPGTPVHDDHWKIAACPVNGPAIAARGARVALAWFTAANDSARVQLAFSRDAAATWAAPVRIDEGRPAGRVDVALLPDGGALVSWIERTGGDSAAVRARRVSPAGLAGSPVTVAVSSAARASGFPRMAVSGGNVMFAWTQPGKPSAIRVARASLASFR